MMNIALIGESGSGKDTVAALLPHRRLAFGDEIRLLIRNLQVNGVGQAWLHAARLLDESKIPTDLTAALSKFKEYPVVDEKQRKLTQDLGTYFRSIDEDIWVNAVVTKMKSGIAYVVTDVRRHNELHALKALGFKGIYVDCPVDVRRKRLAERDGGHSVSTENHVSESEIGKLRLLCDATVRNDGTMDDLRKNVEVAMAFLEFSMYN